MTNGIGRVGWRTYVSPISPLWNNLVAYYRGDNTPNDSKGMYNGTFQRMSYGTPVSGATYSTGIIGNGFILDGINDFVTLPNIPYTSTSLPFSFSCWFNLTKNGTLYDNIEGGTLKGWNIWMSNGQIFVRLASGAYPTEIRTRTTNTLSFNTMYHLTISYSGNTNASGVNIYINGSLVSKTTQFNSCTIASLSPNSNFIGSGYFGTTGGLIDEVGIWDRALTAADATELYNGGAGKQYVAPAPTYTSRTTAFATATGITDTTILNALNTFDTGLISNGLDTKMKALYPFVGGTANTHKFNFMDTRDADAAYRLVFGGGWTHNSTGAQPNGTNGYADTKFKPSNSTYTSFSWGYNLNTNISGTYCEFGVYDPSNNYIVYDYPNDGGYGYVKYGGGDLGFVGGNTIAFHSNTQLSNQLKRFKNGSLLQTFNNSPYNLSAINHSYFMCARNDGGTGVFFSNRKRTFHFMSDALTDTESSTLYNLVQAMQTSLSR